MAGPFQRVKKTVMCLGKRGGGMRGLEEERLQLGSDGWKDHVCMRKGGDLCEARWAELIVGKC